MIGKFVHEFQHIMLNLHVRHFYMRENAGIRFLYHHFCQGTTSTFPNCLK